MEEWCEGSECTQAYPAHPQMVCPARAVPGSDPNESDVLALNKLHVKTATHHTFTQCRHITCDVFGLQMDVECALVAPAFDGEKSVAVDEGFVLLAAFFMGCVLVLEDVGNVAQLDVLAGKDLGFDDGDDHV